MEIKKVTIIGANGSMGVNIAGIFASFGNAIVYLVSREIKKSKEASIISSKSVKASSIVSRFIPVDFSSLEHCIKESDLVFESVAEDIELKKRIHKEINNYLKIGSISCTGSSGLSITRLAECYSSEKRKFFFGLHLFNPPYHLNLCELIRSPYCDLFVYDELKKYLSSKLLRVVADSKDIPGFLANRIGFFFINTALQYAYKYQDNGGIDYIDSIIGPFTGRIMPPLRTADFVGLDVHKAIVDNIRENTNDFANKYFILPYFINELIEKKLLGKKTGIGLYKIVKNNSDDKKIEVFDIKSGNYREIIDYKFPFALKMKECIRQGDYYKSIKELISNKSLEAKICLKLLLEYIVYGIHIAENVGFDASSADDVMAAGFMWCPPFSLMSAFSHECNIEQLMKENLDSCFFKQIDINHIISLHQESKYDFRRFFRAK